jgi:nucleoside-diphosphate-sugar epimerase
MIIAVTGGSGFVGRALIGRLVARGDKVRAVVRSDSAAEVVAGLGAKARRAGLGDPAALATAFKKADVVVHLAAETRQGQPDTVFWRTNVEGTRSVVEAVKRAGVPTLVHMSTEAVLADGEALVDATEDSPIPEDHAGIYGASKAAAEKVALSAPSATRVVVLRPRLVWGRGDTNLLPQFVDAARGGRLLWFDGGDYLTSTTNIDNLVHALELVIDDERARGIYFVTDGPPQQFRGFMTRMLDTQGVAAPTRSAPRRPVAGLARIAGWAWRRLPLRGEAPLNPEIMALMGQQMTVDDSRIRRELGYWPVVSVREGMAQLARS